MSSNNNNNEFSDNNYSLFNIPKEINNNEIPLNLNLNNNNKKNSNYIKENPSKEEILKKKDEEKKEINDIRDKLKCFICYGKLVNAVMCPNCKKLACEQCFKKVLRKKNVCSNCKFIIPVNELIFTIPPHVIIHSFIATSVVFHITCQRRVGIENHVGHCIRFCSIP